MPLNLLCWLELITAVTMWVYFVSDFNIAMPSSVYNEQDSRPKKLCSVYLTKILSHKVTQEMRKRKGC